MIVPEEAKQAADYVNAEITVRDLLITSPALAWLIDGLATDYQVSLAYDGFETRHFLTDYPQERFTFNSSVENARFVLVDRIWENWTAFNVPNMEVVFDEIMD